MMYYFTFSFEGRIRHLIGVANLLVANKNAKCTPRVIKCQFSGNTVLGLGFSSLPGTLHQLLDFATKYLRKTVHLRRRNLQLSTKC